MDWYDGYLFGDTEVYNPWSCVHAVESWRTYINEFPRPYWANTSGNDVVRKLIDMVDDEARAELETLMAGGTISKVVREDITYGDVYKSANNICFFCFSPVT